MFLKIGQDEYQVAENRGEWHIFHERADDRIWGQQYEDGPFASRIEAEQTLRGIIQRKHDDGDFAGTVPAGFRPVRV